MGFDIPRQLNDGFRFGPLRRYEKPMDQPAGIEWRNLPRADVKKLGVWKGGRARACRQGTPWHWPGAHSGGLRKHPYQSSWQKGSSWRGIPARTHTRRPVVKV